MSTYIREDEYNHIKELLDSGKDVKAIAHSRERGISTIYHIKNTKDYNDYRHQYQGRICPCPEHNKQVYACQFCGEPAPEWPGGCIPMCKNCLEAEDDVEDLIINKLDNIQDRLTDLERQLEAINYIIRK